MHITILLTPSIPPGEAELPKCVRYDAYLHPEPPGPDNELGEYLNGKLFKCCLSAAAYPYIWLDLISPPILVVGSVLVQS